jgi:hypothetical protein
LAPATTSSEVAASNSLWLTPPRHGIKIIEVGAIRARFTESCPAPLTISSAGSPSDLAAYRTALTQRAPRGY